MQLYTGVLLFVQSYDEAVYYIAMLVTCTQSRWLWRDIPYLFLNLVRGYYGNLML